MSTVNVSKTAQLQSTRNISPFSQAVGKLRKISGPKDPGLAEAMANVGSFLASDDEVKQTDARKRNLTEELADVGKRLDTMRTNRKVAVLAAVKVGVPYRTITEAWPISLGQITNITRQDRLSDQAATVGGSVTPTQAATAVEGLSKAKFDELMETVAKTGKLPDQTGSARKAKPTRAKVATVVNRTQQNVDMLKVLNYDTSDRKALETIAKGLTRSLEYVNGYIATIDDAKEANRKEAAKTAAKRATKAATAGKPTAPKPSDMPRTQPAANGGKTA